MRNETERERKKAREKGRGEGTACWCESEMSPIGSLMSMLGPWCLLLLAVSGT